MLLLDLRLAKCRAEMSPFVAICNSSKLWEREREREFGMASSVRTMSNGHGCKQWQHRGKFVVAVIVVETVEWTLMSSDRQSHAQKESERERERERERDDANPINKSHQTPSCLLALSATSFLSLFV